MNLANKLYSFYKRHDTAILRVLALMLYSLCLPILTEWVVRGNLKETFEWVFDRFPAYIFTSIFFYFLTFFLFALIRRIDFPILIVSVVAFGLGAASYFKNTYRSEPLYPWDLGIISEAADISSEMNLTPTAAMFIAGAIILAIFGLLLGLHIILFKKQIFKKHKRTKKRNIQLVIQAVVSAAVLVCYTLFVLNNTPLMESFGITESAFRQPQAYRRNGFVQSFIMNTKYILPEKPDGYDSASVSEAVSSVESLKNNETGSVKPNIIYLMSESYADISLCKNVEFHDDIFVATDFLKKHYVSGTLMGAQFGGGTCNSEFEVLTGFSMSYLPAGCTPYQQYFNTETVSYPRFLKELGYNTVAIHSYGKQFWNRDVAYPNMGFDKFISEEDFVEPLRR
ncbi:MAG: sulfatase-like hydrolase/transferase, partial [Oscillospiraceae bacterium]|nr:sulfatase-like hydrolase/transferase [Oscillospiraceae bacterium]